MGNPLLIIPPSLNTEEFTLEKGLMNAVNVGKRFPKILHSFDIGEFTLEKGLMSAASVGKRFPKVLHSFDIREFTGKKSYK